VPTRPIHGRRLGRIAALVGLATGAAGCATLAPGSFVADRAPPPEHVARTPAPSVAAPSPRPTAAPEPAPAPRSLPDLLELALRRDPATRAVWQDARAAAAAAGSRRSLYLPSIDLAAPLARQRTAGSPQRPATVQTTWGVSASLSWLLLDLGGRSALVAEADALALAARLAEHAAVADLVLRVQQTYYQYLAARALVDAETASVKQAEASLGAAEDRRRAGLATIADVLQARTALSQVRLVLQQLEGQSLAFRGALATLAGLPPTAGLEVGTLPADVKGPETTPAVDALLAQAAARNPDLAQARAVADAAGARASAATRAWLPVVTAQASASRTLWTRATDGELQTAWSFGLALRLPPFQGLGPAYDAIGARASAEAAGARADAAAQRVALDVWTSYQGLRTAARRVETSRDLLTSATASAEVTQGRYREGVGSILDLLNAQAALESARGEEVRARADYLVALAALARATGRLDAPAPETTP
jgi:outer membrane protein